MCRFKLWISSACALALFVSFAAPATALAQQAAEQSNPNEPPTTRLTIHPAEPPAIAMQHRLLPRYLDLMPGNAAVQYLKIFPEGGDSALKKYTVCAPGTECKTISDLLNQSHTDFQLDEARKILSEIGNSIFEYLRLAATREDCEWDVPVREQELYSIQLPEIQDMRALARYLALRARVQIVDGEIEQAIETLRVGYALARNASKGPTLIHGLVGVAIASTMNERLRELMEMPNTPNLYWSIAALPDPFIEVRQAMDVESGGVYLMFPQIRDVANAKLTDDQWSLRLAEFGQALNKLGPLLMGPGDEGKKWQEKLAVSLTIAATAAVHYPRAKADLQSYGWSKARLDAMPVAQVILLHVGQTYEVLCDSMFKWFHVPYWQSQDAVSEAERQFADTVKSREILPLASMLLPAVNAARSAVVRLERQIAALRVVEALRFYAARHNGTLPAMLQDIKEVPIPLDPVFGKPFEYSLEGATATLEGKAPEGRAPEAGAFRYLITVAEKKAAAESQARTE